jgi:hypothetical protein
MSKMLWNPTNEEMSYGFSGITYFFKPGERKKVDDACGKHLLHNLGIRGLTVLEYGCDEEAIKRDAIERNREFKKKMIIDFNQRNEIRKQTNFPYLYPSAQMKAYALELGIGLLEPFTVRDAEHEAYAKLQAENEMLKDRLAGMDHKMADLMAMVGNLANQEAGAKMAKPKG